MTQLMVEIGGTRPQASVYRKGKHKINRDGTRDPI